MRFFDMLSQVSYYFLFFYLEMKTYINNRKSNRTKITSRKKNFSYLVL